MPYRLPTSVLLTALLALAVHAACAQTVTVLEAGTGTPLHMVTLSSRTPQAFAVTGPDGRADVLAMAGSLRIAVRTIGHRTVELSFAQLADSAFTVRLARESLPLGQVVAVASRNEAPKGDEIGHFATLTPRDAQLRQPQTTADLLEGSGQVFIQKSQQGGGSPMIRGFATNRLMIVVDGVRMNTAIFRSGNLQNIISIDPLDLERTEVLFGPGSVMYGSDAIGGVMAFSTLRPRLATDDTTLIGGSAMGRWSSANNEFTGHLDVQVARRKWGLLTSISHSDFGDLRMGRHGPDDYLRPTFVQRQDSLDVVVTNDDPLVQRPSAYAQTNVMQKVRYRPHARLDLEYGLHYSTTGNYARYDRHLRTRSNGLPRSAEWNYGPQVWLMNTLMAACTDTTLLFDHLTVRLAHQWFQESRLDRNFNSPVLRIREENVQAYSINLDLSKSVRQRHQLLYGLEGVWNTVQSIGTDRNILTGTEAAAAARYPQADWASLGAYLTYRYRVSDRVLVQAGARYSHFLLHAQFDTTLFALPYNEARTDNGALSGSAGLRWTPASRLEVQLQLATGFRSPNVDDMGKLFDPEPGAVMVPNTGLGAEYAYSAELGIAKVFGQWVKVDATAYFTYLDRALVRRDFTLNGADSILYAGELSRVQALQNAAFAMVYGVQAGLEVMLPKGFGIHGRFNWQRGVEETDDGSTAPLRHAGPWFATAHLTWTHRMVRLDLYTVTNGAVNFQDLAPEERNKPELYAKDRDGNPHSPAWYTLNLRASVQVLRRVTISGGVENITDQRYRTYSSGIAAAGLNFVLAARADF